ncbi:MAG TPA: creatininase family protein [Candidatus Ventrousia excrementavium]|uniref:Creatininase family protein n=1 Tax=Candidatus Ventrousia excrementavium TaxID=2840961 RepID=A0A9D1IUE6_9CLOT|nr:creatininase family protein [Candidatus Ventrousia excrementavium]
MKNPVRWDNLNTRELKALSEQQAIVLLPVGSTEQHGPHLPVGCDNLMATGMSERIAAELNRRGKPCVVAPSIAVANSTHHMSFCGSMTLRAETYMHLLFDYCRSIASHGFRKIVIVNGHGGNVAPTETALIEINEALGFPVYFTGYWKGDKTAQSDILESQTGMIHACEGETSLLWALDEEWIDPIYKETKGNPGYPLEAEEDGTLSTFHRMEAHTENGVMGNAWLASREKGEKMVERMVKGMADVLCDDRLWEQRV